MERKGFGGPRNFGPREMTKTVCSDCGKECEVPFKPTEGGRFTAGTACPNTGNPGSNYINPVYFFLFVRFFLRADAVTARQI